MKEMTQTELEKQRKQEIERLGNALSFQTLMKLQTRIHNIRLYFGNFNTVIKKHLPANECDLVYRVYFITLAILYRSMFKGLDKKGKEKVKIDFYSFVDPGDEFLIENHLSLMNITDKDLAHLDKNSKSHKILNVSQFKEIKHTTLVTSMVSEAEMKKVVDFLSRILKPALQEATAIALNKSS